MPDRMPCAHCGTVGFVRRERVITGRKAFVDHYCGRCDHAWRVAEVNERRAAPRVRPRPSADTPDRSRTLQVAEAEPSYRREKTRNTRRSEDRH